MNKRFILFFLVLFFSLGACTKEGDIYQGDEVVFLEEEEAYLLDPNNPEVIEFYPDTEGSPFVVSRDKPQVVLFENNTSSTVLVDVKVDAGFYNTGISLKGSKKNEDSSWRSIGPYLLNPDDSIIHLISQNNPSVYYDTFPSMVYEVEEIGGFGVFSVGDLKTKNITFPDGGIMDAYQAYNPVIEKVQTTSDMNVEITVTPMSNGDVTFYVYDREGAFVKGVDDPYTGVKVNDSGPGGSESNTYFFKEGEEYYVISATRVRSDAEKPALLTMDFDRIP